MYKSNVSFYQDTDLTDLGWYTCVEWELVDEEAKEQITKDGYEPCNDAAEFIPLAEVKKYGIEESSHMGTTLDFDEHEAVEDLLSMVKEAPYYLVMTHNCRWNGSSGYKITKNILDTINRSYEVSIYPKSVSRGGKCLITREHSHDVPMGAETSIVALTEKEYHNLLDADFYHVSEFIKICEKRCS